MKKALLIAAIIAITTTTNFCFSQNDYKFTDLKRISTTSVKDQASSGTCWSFSTSSFLESEMLRIGKKEMVDLSEMYVVRMCYMQKAWNYVRMQGNTNFGPGGSFHDELWVLENYGMVPEEAYSGLNYGEKKHTHGELDAVLRTFVESIVKNENKKISTAWPLAFKGILDAYFGPVPEKFTYKGKEYTPRSFADNIVALNPNNYVELTSFTHHPFYKKFVLEIPDNWLWSEVYNVPLDEMMATIDNAINNGYTVAWGSDVSEKGFKYNKGYAIVPDADVASMTKTERDKWDLMTDAEKDKKLANETVKTEKVITQEVRQLAFDNQTTTDDHGMHIVGIAKDQNGGKFYIVKNSWDTDGGVEGYFYASEAFVRYKTTSIMIHKDAVSAAIKQKLAI